MCLKNLIMRSSGWWLPSQGTELLNKQLSSWDIILLKTPTLDRATDVVVVGLYKSSME